MKIVSQQLLFLSTQQSQKKKVHSNGVGGDSKSLKKVGISWGGGKPTIRVVDKDKRLFWAKKAFYNIELLVVVLCNHQNKKVPRINIAAFDVALQGRHIFDILL